MNITAQVFRLGFVLLFWGLTSHVGATEVSRGDIQGVTNTQSMGKQYLAIATAFSPELDAITKEIKAHSEGEITSEVKHKGVTYYLGRVGDVPVVVFTTGISIANAAMTTQMALDRFPISRLIMMGIAGAAQSHLLPGDLAIPRRWYYHDESIYAKPVEGAPGSYQLPDIFASLKEQHSNKNDTHQPDYQFLDYLYPNDVRVIKQDWDLPRKQPYFSVSEEMFTAAKTLQKTMPDIRLPSGDKVSVNLGGNGASGSVFVDNPHYRDWVWQTFSASVVDMESTAVGQVCFVNDVDWLVIRSVSDLAGAQKGENTARLFNALAAGTAAKFAVGLINQLSPVHTKYN